MHHGLLMGIVVLIALAAGRAVVSGQAGEGKTAPRPAARPLVIAHRGASGQAPENTLAAFRLAWQQQADGIEGDFYLTRDGQIVCIHDANTQRTAGEKLVVAQSSLEDLRRLDVGRFKGEQFKGQKIPTLQEVLALVPEGKLFFLEIKCGPEIVQPIKDALEKAKFPTRQLVLISFSKEVIRECRKVLPEVKTSWLLSFKKDARTGRLAPEPDKAAATAREIGAHAIGAAGITPEVATAAAQALKELHAWTIDEPKALAPLVDLGVKSITTNYPERIREALAR